MPPVDRTSAEFNRHQAEQAAVDPDLLVPRRDRPTRQARPAVLVAIAAGGALGSPARYAVSRIVPTATNGFPWSTFVINVSGSLVLGALLILVIERWPPTRYVRPFAAIGFLGAYTTFSTFMVEADVLTKDGHGDGAALYVAASLVTGLVAVYAGIVVARWWPTGRRAQ
jgi:CrcB protein